MVDFVDIVLFSSYFLLLFLSIFWLLVFFTEKKEPAKKKLAKLPIFTVIVPAYNEEQSILETLASITSLDYPQEKLEILVVDDGSTDGTADLVQTFILEHRQNNITLLRQENKGKGAALNLALDKVKGEFFACLDADSFVGSNALQEMLPYFEEDFRVAAVCPLLKVRNPKTILQKIQWMEYVINMFYRMLNAKLDCVHVTTGPFSVYRTAVIKELGG